MVSKLIFSRAEERDGIAKYKVSQRNDLGSDLSGWRVLVQQCGSQRGSLRLLSWARAETLLVLTFPWPKTQFFLWSWELLNAFQII